MRTDTVTILACGPAETVPDLVTDHTPATIAGPDDPFSAASEAANCERILGSRRHGLTAATA